MTTKYIIRTSDRKTFKKCRQEWEFGSKLRQDWESNKVSQFLRFGIAFHKGMEVWHDPKTWEWTKDERRNVLAGLAVTAFYKAYPKPDDEYGNLITDPVLVEEWQAESELGAGMLKNFFAQGKYTDTFLPKFVEIEFEVPIVVPDNLMGIVCSQLNFDVQRMAIGDKEFNVLHYNDSPVYYQGRLDMLAEEDGNYWIHDWKTAGKLDSLEWLDLEEQITSYCWALQFMLGIQIKGFVYSEFFKGIPGPPKVNKNGKLSVDKSQSVTKETYLAAIDKLGLPVGDYQDFLTYLENNERQYFRPTQVTRSESELELAGRRIVLEAMDMINEDTFIYPNPSKGNCNFCAFRYPCVLLNEGGDVNYALEAFFHKRGSNA